MPFVHTDRNTFVFCINTDVQHSKTKLGKLETKQHESKSDDDFCSIHGIVKDVFLNYCVNIFVFVAVFFLTDAESITIILKHDCDIF